jgi:hypothetical protein
MAELASAEGIVLPLLDAFRQAPDALGRCATAQILALLARDQPAYCTAMADGGVMGLLLKLYMELDNSDMATLEPALELAGELLRTGTAAVRDLGRAIRGQDAYKSFAAMLILQVGPSFLRHIPTP